MYYFILNCRCCRFYELLIIESLKSLKDIEINPIINDINNGNGLRRRTRRVRSSDLNVSIENVILL